MGGQAMIVRTRAGIRHRPIRLRRVFRAIVSAVFFLGFAGCDHIERWTADPQPGMSGGGWLTSYNSMDDQVDLLTALDPNGYAYQKFTSEGRAGDLDGRQDWPKNKVPTRNWMGNVPEGSPSKLIGWKDLTNSQQIDLAFKAFYDPRYLAAGTPVDRRNRIQEQLLAVSNARCAVFKSILYELRAKSNVVLGTLATVTGVVGGIVSGGASQALAGTSGIFSGTRAEFNQEMFQNLATQVIVEGIDVRRREVYDQIVQRGQVMSIEKYTVEAAVKDAIFYHAQCNVVTGFQVAQDSIKTVADPGIDAANRVLAKLTATRELLQNRKLTPEEAAKLLTKSNALLGLAGTPLANDRNKVLPTTAMAAAQLSIEAATGDYIATVMTTIAQKIKDAAKRPDQSSYEKPAEAARDRAIKHLAVCRPIAIDKSTDTLRARAVAELPENDADKAAANMLDLEKKQLEADKVTKDIQSVTDRVKAHFDTAAGLIASASADSNGLTAAIAAAKAVIDKPVLAGVCK